MVRSIRGLCLPLLLASSAYAGGIEVYDAGNFTSMQLRERTVLLHFYSVGCPPCDEQVKALTALTAAPGSFFPAVLQVDYRTQEDLKSRYRVSAPSTFLLFKGARLIGRTVGTLDAKGILAFVRDTRIKARGRPDPRPKRTYLPKR
ncbi:MAG: thioredoxin family protein [Elusimicrobiota bacterium]